MYVLCMLSVSLNFELNQTNGDETIETAEYEWDEKYYLGFVRREVSGRSATADVNTTEQR